jgi:hypothetical protein
MLQVEAWLILASNRVAVGAYVIYCNDVKKEYSSLLSLSSWYSYLADFSDCFWPFFTRNINALQ